MIKLNIIIACDDINPLKEYGSINSDGIKNIMRINEEFGCKFNFFVPSNFHNLAPLSENKEWVKYWLEKDWVELSAHGHYHNSSIMGECEFYDLSFNQANDRIKLCLDEWNKVEYIPNGWRNPGWICSSESKEVIDENFKYVALHEIHNNNMIWNKSKTFFNSCSIHDDEIIIKDGNIYFQSHIYGDSNKNLWTDKNYKFFREKLIMLNEDFEIEYKTYGELI